MLRHDSIQLISTAETEGKLKEQTKRKMNRKGPFWLLPFTVLEGNAVASFSHYECIFNARKLINI